MHSATDRPDQYPALPHHFFNLHGERYFDSKGDSYGGCSSVGRAPGCGPGGRGFKSHHSPHKEKRTIAATGCNGLIASAPVAQLDRVPDFESVGRGFESLRARQFKSMGYGIVRGPFYFCITYI